MLRSLHIENIAVIRTADVDFDAGFSVLTGETGAGKSILIDSINLLLGNRTSAEIVRSGEKTATVSAVFENLNDAARQALAEMGFSCEDGTLMLQRTLTRDGRSQSRLNGRAITQSMQREIAGRLVNIHGQTDSQKLLQKANHLELLDAYLHDDALSEAYRAAYRLWKESKKKLQDITEDEAERLRLCEMLRYQIADIEDAKLKCGEEEALIAERDRLQHLDKINRQVHMAYRALRGGEKNSAFDLVSRAAAAVSSLDQIVDGCDALAERLETVRSEIEDVAELVLAYADEDGEDPTARLDRLEGRLDTIERCTRKYGGSVEKTLEFCANARARLDALELSDEARLSLEREIDQQEKQVALYAEELHRKRVQAASQVELAVTEALTFLDMPKVKFEIRVAPTEYRADGADDVEFLVATNVGEPLQPMRKIASGGELSRIMLALRSVLHDKDGADTVIFDEIDAGVSGKTARKVGIKLRKTAEQTQVFCVTHSAQIASLAHTHYRIVKTEQDGRAQTQVLCLDEETRVEELARILGGIRITDAQRAAAVALLHESDE